METCGILPEGRENHFHFFEFQQAISHYGGNLLQKGLLATTWREGNHFPPRELFWK
jgi:hypothetical protein